MELVGSQAKSDVLELDDGRQVCFSRDEVIRKGPRKPVYLLHLKSGERLALAASEIPLLGIKPALRTTEMILDRWQRRQFFSLIVYGEPGKGKSVYTLTLLSEVYGKTGYDSHITSLDGKPVLIVWERNWDAWKQYMVFLPEDFFRNVDAAQEQYEVTGKPVKLIVWDDAGLWISRYWWMMDFSKLFSDYLNVIRTDYSAVVFTTPSAKKLLKDVRELPGMHTGRPAEISTDHPWARYININAGWMSPDFKKDGVKTVAKDFFRAWLPDEVYREYDKVRRAYAKIAKERCKQAIDAMIKDGQMSYARRYMDEVREAGIDLGTEEAQ